MHFFSDLIFIVAIYAFARSIDLMISAIQAKDTGRAVSYGLVMLLLLFAIGLNLIGIH